MTLIEQCLEQVAAVRDSASDPRAAYVIRSRLERLMLTCARAAAEASGLPKPELPQLTPVVPQVPPGARSLVAASSKLYDLSSSICRPSESFDARWDEGWPPISRALDELEGVLRTQPSSTGGDSARQPPDGRNA